MMARIFRPEQDQQAPGLRPISPGGAGLGAAQIGRVQQQLGNAVAVQGEAFFKEANAALENAILSKALTESTVALNQATEERKGQVKDKDGKPMFSTLVSDVTTSGREIQNKAAAAILNPKLKNKFNDAFSAVLAKQQISAFKEQRTQAIEFAKASVVDFVNNTAREALSGDINNADVYEEQITERLADAVASGAMTPLQADTYKRNAITHIRSGNIQRAMIDEPLGTFNMLEGSTPEELGIDFNTYHTLRKQAAAAVRDEERKLAAIQKEEDKNTRESQNLTAADVGLRIEFPDRFEGVPPVTELEIQQLSDEGLITRKQEVELKGKLFKAQQVDVTQSNLTKSIQRGELLADYKASDITTHYNNRVREQSKKGDMTLAKKAALALDYRAPIKPLQGELSMIARNGTEQEMVDGIRVYETLVRENPTALSGMKAKDEAIYAYASALVQGAGQKDAEAMRIARESVTAIDDSKRAEFSSAFNSVDTFKFDNIPDVIDDMFGTEGQPINDETMVSFRRILRQAYIETGDEDAAITLAKRWTGLLWGNSTVNDTGVPEFMLLPPEKIYPGIQPDVIRESFVNDMKGVTDAPEHELAIVSDTASRIPGEPISYMVVRNKEMPDGRVVTVPILTEGGSLLRWRPDRKELNATQEKINEINDLRTDSATGAILGGISNVPGAFFKALEIARDIFPQVEEDLPQTDDEAIARARKAFEEELKPGGIFGSIVPGTASPSVIKRGYKKFVKKYLEDNK